MVASLTVAELAAFLETRSDEAAAAAQRAETQAATGAAAATAAARIFLDVFAVAEHEGRFIVPSSSIIARLDGNLFAATRRSSLRLIVPKGSISR